MRKTLEIAVWRRNLSAHLDEEIDMGNLKKIDDARVRKFIDYALQSAAATLGSGFSVEITHRAWIILKVGIRGKDDHSYDYDYDAAAAEHYMFIRWVAGNWGDPACHLAPVGYAAKKIWEQLRGKLQTGAAQHGHPVLPANPYIVAWGNKGVADGLADYKKVNPGKPYKYGAAVEGLASFSYSSSTSSKLGAYFGSVGHYLPK